MSSAYFCKTALARSEYRNSSPMMYKQANAVAKAKKALMSPLGGALGGAGLAGAVGLNSIRGLQQELANKAIVEAQQVAQIQRLSEMARAGQGSLVPQSSHIDDTIGWLDNTANKITKNYGAGTGGMVDDILNSDKAHTVIDYLNRGNNALYGAYGKLTDLMY